MKFRALRFLFAAMLIMALAGSVFAQASTPVPAATDASTPAAAATAESTPAAVASVRLIAGNYTFSGANADGSNPYTGTLTITGVGGVHTLSYTQGSAQPVTSTGLLTGNVLFAASGDPSCSNTVYTRFGDGSGRLLGKWIDAANSGKLGIDVLTPMSKPTDFESAYTEIGTDGGGGSYEGMAVIDPVADGAYGITYDYPATSSYAAYTIAGYGLADGNQLGISISADPTISADKCNLWMLEFQPDGSYKGTFVNAGVMGTETGKLAS